MIVPFFKQKSALFYILLSILLYASVAYFFERTQFFGLLLSFVCLFVLAYKIIETFKQHLIVLMGIAFIFRLVFLFAVPNLSQGFNPYTHLPKDLITNADFHLSQAQELYHGMGNLSASHFSNYPPINQLFFLIAGWFSPHSIIGAVVMMRIIIIMADFGTLYFGSKLLAQLGFEKHRIFWYILNPLVIIELTGNLHFEGVMLFFLVWSMYLLHQNQWKMAALTMALSISTKLLPLILLPMFFQKLGWKKSIGFYSLVFGLNLLLFLPFFSHDLFENYTETIGLWFTNFEFNASIYYVVRAIGFWMIGYNIIQTTGQIIPFFILIFVIYNSIFSDNKSTVSLFQSFLMVLSFYFFTSTTVHPWYVINLVLIGVFTKFKYPIIWSLTVFLSYSAYSNFLFKENLWFIGLEYGLVFLFIIIEIKRFPIIKK